jgi:group I intron endonuclease
MKTNYYLKKICGIYCFTHIESGRQYCGQSVDCAERFKQHTTPKKGAAGIKGAIMKYGVDAFSFQILEECKREELNEREVWWIAQLGTLSPGGYNQTSGGGQGTSISDETKERLSAALKGRAKSEETRAKMSEAHKGKKHSALNEEANAKRSAALKGRAKGPKSEETRAKQAASLKEYWRKRRESAETCKEFESDV